MIARVICLKRDLFVRGRTLLAVGGGGGGGGGGDGSWRVIDAQLVDFQLARYAPPALDVWTLLMLCTVRDFRRTHARSLLDWYYESLKELLNGVGGLEIEKVIPRAQFDASCAYFELAGLIETLLFSHLTLIPKRLAKDMLQCSDTFDSFLRGNGKERVCLESFETDATYRDRLSEMLTELIESYCLVD